MINFIKRNMQYLIEGLASLDWTGSYGSYIMRKHQRDFRYNDMLAALEKMESDY